MLRYLQLQQHFDANKLQTEVAKLEESFWKQHYNKNHYEGKWTVLALRAINGNAENVVAIHSSAGNANPYSDTQYLEECPYIQSVLHFFSCEKTSVRLMKLHAGAEIKEHCDHEMSFEEGEVRFHVPVVTNSDVWFMLDGERVVMQEGECWYLNLSRKHGVKNCGDTDRVHLVIDCMVNDWVKKLFAENALMQNYIDEKKDMNVDKETKQRIINELRHQNTPTSLQLALALEKEIQ